MTPLYSRWVVLGVVFGAACTSAPSRHPAPVRGRQAAAVLDSVRQAEATRAIAGERETPAPVLPAQSTFVWATREAKDSSRWRVTRASSGPMRSMQDNVEMVLIGQGWRMVPLDSAEFRFDIAVTQRTWYEQQSRQQPGSAPRSNCDLTRSANCPPPPPPRVEVINVPRSSESATLVVSRRGAGVIGSKTFDYPNPSATGALMTRAVIGWLAPRKK